MDVQIPWGLSMNYWEVHLKMAYLYLKINRKYESGGSWIIYDNQLERIGI